VDLTSASGRYILSSYYLNSGASLWGSLISAAQEVVSHVRTPANAFARFAFDEPADKARWLTAAGVWNGAAEPVNGRASGSLSARLADRRRAQYPAGANCAYTNDVGRSAVTGHVRSRLGANTDNLTMNFDGRISEFLVYNAALSDDDVKAVMDYLHRRHFPPSGTLISVQ
jgi:hypothetical protein